MSVFGARAVNLYPDRFLLLGLQINCMRIGIHIKKQYKKGKEK